MFFGALAGPGVDSSNNSGIFKAVNGVVEVVARTGISAGESNLSDGVYFEVFRSAFLNHSGDTAFLANLAGTGVNDTNDLGLFINSGDEVKVLVRTGNVIDVDPTSTVDLRKIDDIRVSGEDKALGNQFDGNPLVAFLLAFTDGSSGIFTAAIVPEPSRLAMLSSIVSMLLMCRGKRSSAKRA
jgi:hypothetical protein